MPSFVPSVADDPSLYQQAESKIDVLGFHLSSRTVAILILVPLLLVFCCCGAFLVFCAFFGRKKESNTRDQVMYEMHDYISHRMDYNKEKVSPIAERNHAPKEGFVSEFTPSTF